MLEPGFWPGSVKLLYLHYRGLGGGTAPNAGEKMAFGLLRLEDFIGLGA